MTITEPKIYPFVYVRWKDASHASGTWQNECEDPLEPVLDCETGGFLIKQTTDFIIVAAAIAYHEDVVTPSFASEITIPMCAVSEIRVIERIKAKSDVNAPVQLRLPPEARRDDDG